MAAAIAAAMPAPTTQAAPAPAPLEIPATMEKAIDVEAAIPITSVQLDGMVRTSCSSRFAWLLMNWHRL